MKVLIINTVRFRLNGMTSVIMNYYRNIEKSDMQIDFVVPNVISDEYRAELEGNGSRIYQIPRKKNPLKYMQRLRALIRKNKYDIVHVHGNSAMMYFDIRPAYKENVPVRIVHSHNTTCSHMRMHKILKKPFSKMYTHGFACGVDAGKWLYGNGEFEVLRNGIDLKNYAYNEALRKEFREKIGAGDRFVLGHVGNFIEQKNHSFMLDFYADLLKKDSNYLLLLISDGALLDAMKEKAKALGIEKSVLFLGKTTEVASYLQAMDAFILPSLHEGLPVVIVEALAVGLPCVVADTVSREADLAENVKFIPIDNERIWVDAISDVKASACDRNVLCADNQKKISDKGYDITTSAGHMKELYKEYLR